MTGEQLNKYIKGPDIYLCSSTMTRGRETTRLILTHLNNVTVDYDDNFREVGFVANPRFNLEDEIFSVSLMKFSLAVNLEYYLSFRTQITITEQKRLSNLFLKVSTKQKYIFAIKI